MTPGALLRHADFPSRHVAPRHVDVWLPPGYGVGAGRYPVLYMHDGQNVFDRATASGGTPWGVDDVLAGMIARGEARPALVVGIWHGLERWREYAPQKPLAHLPPGPVRERYLARAGGETYSDRYLAFMVGELKPFIDREYRTLPGRPDTLVMGSSMGGLVSLYAVSEYPGVFGGAGCVSTHWPAGEDVLVDQMGAALPPPASHRVYFDFGTETLDAAYEPFQKRMDAHLEAAGFERGRNWLTLKFDGAEHSERSWRERVHIPLAFLLGGGSPQSTPRSRSAV